MEFHRRREWNCAIDSGFEPDRKLGTIGEQSVDAFALHLGDEARSRRHRQMSVPRERERCPQSPLCDAWVVGPPQRRYRRSEYHSVWVTAQRPALSDEVAQDLERSNIGGGGT